LLVNLIDGERKIKYLLFVSLLSLIQPQLLSPENNATLNYTHVPFYWIQDVEAIVYQLQISTSNTFTTNMVVDKQVSSHYYIEKSNLEWGNQYYWRVRSVDTDDGQGDWSAIFSFSIGEDSDR